MYVLAAALALGCNCNLTLVSDSSLETSVSPTHLSEYMLKYEAQSGYLMLMLNALSCHFAFRFLHTHRETHLQADRQACVFV